MQHLAVPQHLMDLDMSSSSMCFLRGKGPDISLDQILQDLQTDDSSSSSSDVSSGLNEDWVRFLAAQQHCATISLFHRRGIPNTAQPNVVQPRSTIASKPILIDRAVMQDQIATQNSSGFEIVPWRPCLHALAL